MMIAMEPQNTPDKTVPGAGVKAWARNESEQLEIEARIGLPCRAVDASLPGMCVTSTRLEAIVYPARARGTKED
jgi:hypothetical protein